MSIDINALQVEVKIPKSWINYNWLGKKVYQSGCLVTLGLQLETGYVLFWCWWVTRPFNKLGQNWAVRQCEAALQPGPRSPAGSWRTGPPRGNCGSRPGAGGPGPPADLRKITPSPLVLAVSVHWHFLLSPSWLNEVNASQFNETF